MPTREPLISAAQIPNRAARTAETYLKRRLFAWEDATVRQLLSMYRSAYSDLRARAFDSAPAVYGNNGDTVGWRREYLAYAERRLKTLAREVADYAFQRAVTAFMAGYYGRLWLLDVATKPDVSVGKPPPPHVDVLMKVLQPRMSEAVNDAIYDLLGREWREQYANELDDLILRLRRGLNQSMLNGESMQDAMRRVSREMGVETDRRRGQVGSAQRTGNRANFNRVQTLTRTAIMQSSNAGALVAYRANADVVSGWQWLTARDERVCVDCRSRNMEVHKLNDYRTPPAHHNCRCTVIPVVTEDVLAPAHEPPRATLGEWSRSSGVEHVLRDFLGGRLESSRI